jgi:hypothetical protein
VGQSPIRTVVRVQIADSTGAPVGGADVAILASRNRVVVRATTNDDGRQVLLMSPDSGDYELVVRKIGFQRSDQFFRAAGHDTMSFSIRLAPLVQVLEPVKVVGKEERRHQYLFIDAAGIANSGEELDDAVDVIRRLRPRMALGLAYGAGWCAATKDVWVNGVRIYPEFVGTDFGVLMRYGRQFTSDAGATYMGMKRGQPVRMSMSTRRLGGPWPVTAMADHVLLVLSKIKPEHIAQMRRIDCDEPSPFRNPPRLGTEDALFVVLKAGIGFDLDNGSYVVHPDRGTPKP